MIFPLWYLLAAVANAYYNQGKLQNPSKTLEDVSLQQLHDPGALHSRALVNVGNVAGTPTLSICSSEMLCDLPKEATD